MYWSEPHISKTYEAIGAIGDDRIEAEGNTAKVYSSSRNKYYDVEWDPNTQMISSNDNSSYWVGDLGYPSIALLIVKHVITCDPSLITALSGFAWKDINQKYKNNFDKTVEEIRHILETERGVDMVDFDKKLSVVIQQVNSLKLKKPAKKKKPPTGY